MAVNEIRFRDLPFRPSRRQVLYIEKDYDTDVNNFIRRNYQELKSIFSKVGLDFYYLPYLLKENDVEAKIRYYAPYLSSRLLVTKVQSKDLVRFIADSKDSRMLKPSFIFGGTQAGDGDDARFMQAVLPDIDFIEADALEGLKLLMLEMYEAYCLETMRNEIQECRTYSLIEGYPKEQRTCCCFQNPSDIKDGVYSLSAEVIERSDDDSLTELAEYAPTYEQSLTETAKVLRELRITVQRLRLEGVSLMAIHEFIDKQEPLSCMIITSDYRIFLPDYNGMEIEMGALPKAVYFLFLRYPGGIICKHMQDYYNELLNIYRQLRPNTDEARLVLTVTKVVNPLGNALNENIARIRKAFVGKFDEHLAVNYIITGERGSQYLVSLDRDLITWEE